MSRTGYQVPLLLLLFLALLFGSFVLLSTPVSAPGAEIPALHSVSLPQNSSSSSASSGGVTCPSGSTLTWGPISLNCFQSLDLTEVAALLIGIVIAVYIYWNSDKAELPGDSVDIPVTAEEEVAVEQRKKGEGP